MSERNPATEGTTEASDAQWYKDAVIYQMHVRTFADSNDDGIGDFAGATQKLDYLKDLGVTAIWVMPFYPSPLLDDGYDIAEYTDVHPSYGNLRDVRTFIREAHRRGLKVITELVCNHTSDQHPWFQRARRARPGSAARDFYVWSDTDDKYKATRIIFKDFESSNWSWDPVANAYYWHRFYRHQPDLNFENPRVHEALFRVLDFWLEMGVDGLRLDAIPYLYEEEGTSNENLPQGFEYLRKLRKYIDDHYEGRMLLAEANQWPEDAVAYFGDGDICQMAFHFPVMPRLFMAIHQEDRFPIIDIVRQTPAIPENCQWAVFLRNHDELTLEMVTDEERDYMYRVYAADQRMRINLGIRRRLAPLLGNHRRRIELMNALLFALPGTPVLYYGDEIGMGDNVYLGDRNGVRTPMQWSGDRNAGFSRANPQRLYLPVIIDPEYHYETVNVEAQVQNQHSLLWWTKRLIALRKRYRAFGRGSMEFLQPENRKVLTFIRRFEDERILIVANLSRFAQGVSIDLSEFQGMVPVEMFGRVELPPITDQPYFFTLGPHSFFWFSLEPQKVPVGRALGEETPAHVLSGTWEGLFDFARSNVLAQQLPDFMTGQRWFSGKGRRVRSTSIEEAIPVRNGSTTIYLTLINVQYSEGVGETYMLPLTYAHGEAAFQRIRSAPHSVVLRLKHRRGDEEGILYDAMYDEGFATVCLNAVERRQHLKTERGELVGSRTAAFREIGIQKPIRAEVLRADQTNTSINYGDKLLFKLFRRLEPGINPDLEIGRYLTTENFKHSPRVAGAIEYRRGKEEPITLGVLNEFINKESDAWTYTLDSLRDFLESTMPLTDDVTAPAPTASTFMRLSEEEPPPLAIENIGSYLESARLLGIRTAEMHAALGSGPPASAFSPEPYTPHYQRGVYQSLRNMTTNNFALLARHVREATNPSEAAAKAIGMEEAVLAHFRRITSKPITSSRLRAHGDYHLGQVLYTGNDFVITDFEGEPSRTITERRIRRSPLRDVAGMLRSFSYAVHSALQELRASGVEGDLDEHAQQWGRFWECWVSSTFLRAYLEEAKQTKIITADWAEIELLLDVFMLEKVVYEIGYELNNRPDWLAVPLSGLLEIVQTES